MCILDILISLCGKPSRYLTGPSTEVRMTDWARAAGRINWRSETHWHSLVLEAHQGRSRGITVRGGWRWGPRNAGCRVMAISHSYPQPKGLVKGI